MFSKLWFLGLVIKTWVRHPSYFNFLSGTLKKGDSKPPRPNKQVPRLYNFSMSPYGERVRLVLKAKNIEHEIINVHLGNKPDWLTTLNPAGQIPVLEWDRDDKIICESNVICEFLDNDYPNTGPPLGATDPYQREKDREFATGVDEYMETFHVVLHTKDSPTKHWQTIQTELKKLDKFIANRRDNKKFLSGDVSPGLIDYMVWPIVGRLIATIDVTSGGVSAENYLPKELPAIHDYRRHMLGDSVVRDVSPTLDQLVAFIRIVIAYNKL
ncbi:unnamed protein product [Oppiella nova]|uniref:Uncharacterized protein n=1 Tax=Oppiella nova TaxID=334625 RepID=A0A7R9QIH6_9ACAR|nr:unnamed protein product [Oppiella nova]CAG2166647.1 unnamed protein product [Oppiella nova]